MHNFWLIIKREFIAKVSSKSYLVLLFLSPMLMIGMFVSIFYFAEKDANTTVQPVRKVLVYGDHLLDFYAKNTQIVHLNNVTEKKAKILLENETFDASIFVDYKSKNIKIVSRKNFPVDNLVRVINRSWTKFVLIENNIPANLVNKAMVKPKINTEYLSEANSEVTKWVKGTVAVGSGYLIMMFVIIYGNSVMKSIIEEKNSRVIEIMVCTVKPFHLMMGKIIGNALAGVLQFVIWGSILILGLLFLNQSNLITGLDSELYVSIFKVIWSINYYQIFGCFILFFLAGYLLYSSIYAAVGSAVNSETDTQQFVHPILLPLMFGVYIGIATVVNGNPNGETATLFSMIPLTSPIVMLMRIPFGVPVWQILISLGLIVISFVVMVFISAKIYRIGILSYGNKPSLKQIIKWLKY